MLVKRSSDILYLSIEILLYGLPWLKTDYPRTRVESVCTVRCYKKLDNHLRNMCDWFHYDYLSDLHN